MSPERHHWKPAAARRSNVENAPHRRPVTGQPGARYAHFLYTARNFENAPVTRRSPASSARTPRRAFALCRHIAGWTQAWWTRYVAIATQPVPRLQIRPIVHNKGQPLPRPKLHPVSAVVWANGRGQTDTHTQTRVTTIHFASSTTHAKCNNLLLYCN